MGDVKRKNRGTWLLGNQTEGNEVTFLYAAIHQTGIVQRVKVKEGTNVALPTELIPRSGGESWS